MNITKKWTKTKGTKGTLVERKEYTVNGVVYQVDVKYIVSRPTEQERAVATILSTKYGKRVELVSQVMYPQGIQTPDYLIDGERFDLKSFKSEGKNVIYNMVSKKKNQVPNFIFDFTKCLLSESEIERQIKDVYSSIHTRFIKKIVVMKDGNVLKVYERK